MHSGNIIRISVLRGIHLVLVLLMLRADRFTADSSGAGSQINFTDALAFIHFNS